MIMINILILIIILLDIFLITYIIFKKGIRYKFKKTSILLIVLIYFFLVFRNLSIYVSIDRYKPYVEGFFSFYLIENRSMPRNINDIKNNDAFKFSKGKFRGYEPELGYTLSFADSAYYFYALGFDFDDDEAKILFEPDIWTCFNVFKNGDILIFKDNLP